MNEQSPDLRLTLTGPSAEAGRLRLDRAVELDESGDINLLRVETLEDAEPAGRRSFWELPSLAELAHEQRVQQVASIEELADGTWPADESLDDFLAAIESRD